MSYFSERKGLKCAFVCAAMATALGGFGVYSIAESKPNPMAFLFSGIFGFMAAGSYKEYRSNANAAKTSQNQTLKP